MEKYYSFPAIFHYDDDGISIEFPDLPGCLPCADTTEEAFACAKEALGLHLYGMEQDHEPIPTPCDASKLKTHQGDLVAMIEVFMPSIRDRLNNKVVKKTLTIPAWLNRQAEEANINFSQILQDGIKNYLNNSSHFPN